MGHKHDIYTHRAATRSDILLSRSERKMTLAELKTLVDTMQNLPCVMNQLEEVQVRSNQRVFCVSMRSSSPVSVSSESSHFPGCSADSGGVPGPGSTARQ